MATRWLLAQKGTENKKKERNTGMKKERKKESNTGRKKERKKV